MSTAAKKADTPKTDSNPLFKENVINAICVGVQDTLSMMAQVKAVFEKPTIEMVWKTQGDVTGVIDFETTNFRGSLYIHFPSEVLIKLYNTMVGESLTTVSPEVVDCIGEISNMAYGVAKGKLDPLKLNFSMSLPKSMKTTELKRMAAPHLLIPFKVYDKRCVLEITLGTK
jgi:CheY-specific phosphatase CheX